MALTPQQQAQIAATYAPILILHPDEAFYPIRPEKYLQTSALWQSTPASDRKADWGLPPPGFPRLPTIPKFGISLNPAEDTEGTADPDHDGVNEWYLGHKAPDGTHPYLTSTESSELFLENAGWSSGDAVTDSSDNSRCNPDGAKQVWEPQPGGIFQVEPWHHAEVQETSDIERVLIAMGESDGKPIGTIIEQLLGEIWIVWYYFLYPVHTEYLRRCEQVFEGGTRGDFEGDWSAVAVVIQKPTVLPWDQSGSFPAPQFVGYGVRIRGLAKDVAPSLFKLGMIIQPWDTTSRIGLHPRIFVTQGYHNNNFVPGDRDPFEQEFLGTNLAELTCEATEAGDEFVRKLEGIARDIGHTVVDIAVTIAKVYAGASAGFGLLGPAGVVIGALAGAAAGIAEALSSSSTDDVPDKDTRQLLEREPGPPATGSYGRVIKPDDVADPLTHEPTRPEIASQTLVWAGSPAERLVDRANQIWWPGDSNRPGFDGRWGVRCENDPLDRRSGIPFPDFRRALLNDLALHLAATQA
jgi:hypothetical protein